MAQPQKSKGKATNNNEGLSETVERTEYAEGLPPRILFDNLYVAI